MSNTITDTRQCAHCAEGVTPHGVEGCNFVDDHGNPQLLCGPCWDQAEGLVCSHCDRLAANYYEQDQWSSEGLWRQWGYEWANHWTVLCVRCSTSLDEMQGVK